MSLSRYSFRESSSSSGMVDGTVVPSELAFIFSIACEAVVYKGLPEAIHIVTKEYNLLELIVRLIFALERIAL